VKAMKNCTYRLYIHYV